jgi:UDP-glucose 4-epimerase
LVPALASAGHNIRAASRRRKTAIEIAGVEWIKLPDLQAEFDWSSLLDGVEIVVHLAAIANPGHSDADQLMSVNYAATARLVRACAAIGIKRLIFVSSIGAQTGPACDHVITEKDDARPVTAYGRAKLAAEEAVRGAGVPFTILRPVLVYGPGAKGNFATIMRIASLPLPLPFAAMNNRRSLLAVDNLIEAVSFCLNHDTTINQMFIVTDRDAIAFADIIVTLRRAAGRPPKLLWIPPQMLRLLTVALGQRSLWDRIGRNLIASSAEFQKLGWSPRVDTMAGLHTTTMEFISERPRNELSTSDLV